MEKFFNIKYEFDKQRVWQVIDSQIAHKKPGYICVADGVVVNNVQRNQDYRRAVNNSMFAICDSGWVPTYLHWIYGIERHQYCGPMIFKDLVARGKHRMFFMGTNQKTLDGLKKEMTKLNPEVANMTFYELPFKSVEEFDYEAIAKMVEEDGADLIWVALGAPKQDFFMERLAPHLKKGVMLGVGAAFNFYSGLGEKRAPQWVVKSKIEFLYRILQSPKKQIKRCFWILATMPSMFLGEMQRKRAMLALENPKYLPEHDLQYASKRNM